jgi:ribonucleotide reductase alpha subunit
MTETVHGAARQQRPAQRLAIKRVYTTPDVHPYAEVLWQQRDVVLTNWRDGSVNFEQRGVEFPDFWSVNAANIVTTKYFRGAVGTPERETSLRQLIDRVVHKYGAAGREHGYFASEQDAVLFEQELIWMLLHQVFSFNSPVWFNVGTPAPQQVSACQPYDALVSTPEGLVPIGKLVEDAAVGTKVYDARGLTSVVAVKDNGVKEVLRLHTKAGYVLDVTADHLVWKATGEGTGAFVPAGTLEPGSQLEWHRREAHGEREIDLREISEGALAGWMQSDGFVGQYDHGTNRSLTIEAMTVNDAELNWVTTALDVVFPAAHRHEREVVTQSETLDCRRTRLYGEHLRPFIERWGLLARGVDMVVPAQLFTAPLPVVAAYVRSLFQAEGYVSARSSSTLLALDMVSEELVRGVQSLLLRFGIFARASRKEDARENRLGTWTLRIQSEGDRDLFETEIGFIDPVKQDKLARSFDLPGRIARSVKRLEIASVEVLGDMPVYDIQTESGEYLSGGLRVHNCFILAVDDQMDSILNWYREEGLIFKGGSGAGLNLSRIRSSKELLSSGGTASGPVSFMRGADASAGTIKSGGATRRAAKMVVLDVDHPDIEEFIETKAREEDKIRALRDAGFDMDLGGKDIVSVQYQNANNSVRVSDEFMRAVEEGKQFGLRGRLDNQVLETVDARALWRKLSQAAWECADPGIQYDDTINDWHTNPETGRITASNPCCFTGDTLVQTVDGPVAFQQLFKAFEAGESARLVSFDPTVGALVEREAVRVWVAGHTASLIEVVTHRGLRLRCTPEHRFLLTDGSWIEAQALAHGCALVAEDGVDQVDEVTRLQLDTALPVYDLEVQGTRNFVVTAEGLPGVVVHNSEYMSLDNSSCNLASLNLMTFLRDDGTFEAQKFAQAVEVIITAMDISICFADFPTEPIAETTRAYRQLGIGYANLGALLMATGHAYDSDGGRALAGAITSLMTGTAYKRSAELAAMVGPYEGYARNADAHKRIIRKHAAANDAVRAVGADDARVLREATKAWRECLELGERNGYRNAQASVIAPTGTIGLMMDCDTTGLEPDLALVKFKKLVGGASMQIVNGTVPRALRSLGYQEESVEAIVEHISDKGNVIDAPGLKPEHYSVFDCAMGERYITPMGHVKMMAAIQPFVSGALSKTVNLPAEATVEDVERVYFQGWKLGLKALAIYRNNSKVGQPLTDKKQQAETVEQLVAAQPIRRRLPKKRRSQTISFSVAGAEGYMTAGEYDDGTVGETFIKMSKQGSTLAGVMDAFSVSISIGLQYGVPLEAFVSKFTNMRFDPAGMTDDPDIRIAQSVMDYLFRRLALDYLPYDKRADLGIFSAEERAAAVAGSSGGSDDVDVEGLTQSVPVAAPRAAVPAPARVGSSMELLEAQQGTAADAPLCMTCGVKMRPAGSCYVCESCGSTSGCS